MSSNNGAFKSREVVQFVNGAKKGLLAQMALIDGALKCLSRDMDGTPHVFDIADTDDARLIGVAVLGPKQDRQPAAAEEPQKPAPLSPTEIEGLLEPLPADVKPEPLGESQPAADFTPEERRALTHSAYVHTHKKRRKKKPKAAAAKLDYTAKVTNGLGEETIIALKIRTGVKPELLTGVAISLASKKIKSIRPFTVSDWTLVDQNELKEAN